MKFTRLANHFLKTNNTVMEIFCYADLGEKRYGFFKNVFSKRDNIEKSDMINEDVFCLVKSEKGLGYSMAKTDNHIGIRIFGI